MQAARMNDPRGWQDLARFVLEVQRPPDLRRATRAVKAWAGSANAREVGR
jgi:hypothetical protein